MFNTKIESIFLLAMHFCAVQRPAVFEILFILNAKLLSQNEVSIPMQYCFEIGSELKESYDLYLSELQTGKGRRDTVCGIFVSLYDLGLHEFYSTAMYEALTSTLVIGWQLR